MSDYPATPHYGANYGGQNQQNPPYLPPTYPNQYPQTDESHMPQHQYAPSYDADVSGYGYNGGVPGFSAAALAAGAPPLPIYQGWHQDPASLPAYNPTHNNIQHVGYGAPLYDGFPQQYPPPAPQQTQHSYQQHLPTTKTYDEGEVSEGDFDGRYTQKSAVNQYASQYPGNGGNGYIDTAHRAVYTRSQDPIPLQAHRTSNEYNYSREAHSTRHPQSGSYSPHVPSSRDDDRDELSTRNEHYNTATPKNTPNRYVNGNTQLQNQSAWEQNHSAATSWPTTTSASPHVNENQAVSVPQSKSSTQVTSTLAHFLPSPGAAATTLPGIPSRRSSEHTPALQVPHLGLQQSTIVYDKTDLRKKAEGAILNLLPHDIRFEKYTEEGIAEEVVGQLFDNLRLPRTYSKPINNVNLDRNLEQKEPGISLASAVDITSEGSRQMADGKRSPIPSIEKAARVSTPNRNTTLVASTSANHSGNSGTSEKEKTLKLKMEALKRSREERAQKAAAKSASKATKLVQPPLIIKSDKAEPGVVTKSLDIPVSLVSSHLNTQQSQSELVKEQSQLPNTIPAAPAIPGLFLASITSTSPPSNGIIFSTLAGTQVNPRKRPVAADFDTPSTATAYKRPFGHSQSDTPLVIDVSEDEGDSDDGDVAMDLESQADQDSPIQTARKMSDQRSAAVQGLPMLTNFPARKPFTPPPVSSAASTPPVFPPSRKATLGRPEVLQEKEMQIEELRRKIAEAEAAKAQKRAQQSASGTQTPRLVTNGEHKAAVDDSVAKKVEASMQMQNMIDIAEEKVNSDQKRLLEAETTKQEKAADLKRQEAERKRLRREKIATDLPRVDAEVVEKQRKLEQLKVQMAEIEAEVQRNLGAKQRMAEEMERLGQEAEDQLQAQKAKLKDLTAGDCGLHTLPARPTPIILANGPENSSHSEPGTNMLQPAQFVPGHTNGTADPTEATDESEKASPIQNDSLVSNLNGSSEDLSHSPNEPDIDSGESMDIAKVDQDLEAALQDAVRAQVDSQDTQGQSDAMDIEDSYAPDPDQLAPETTPSSTKDADRSPSYSPVIERNIPIVSDRQSEADYEPPEAAPSADRSPTQSPPFSPAPAEPIVEEVADLIIFPNNHGLLAADANDSVEPPLPRMNGSVPALVEGSSANKSDHINAFTPYESPLKSFRAFRFHPSFNRDVPGGFRSLTYSHKINPNVEFCPWEMAGGACNDQACEFQHLRDIGLPDDAVLSSLGSPEEFTGDQRKQFCDGLKEVLSGLRARKIRDFDIIAKEVVAHRARFFGDSSKVLMLEGTTI